MGTGHHSTVSVETGKDRGTNRRTFLKAAGGASVAIAAGLRPGVVHANTGTVTILTWETYHDDPWAAAYSERTGVKVTVVRAGSVDEMRDVRPALIRRGQPGPRLLRHRVAAPLHRGRAHRAGRSLPCAEYREHSSLARLEDLQRDRRTDHFDKRLELWNEFKAGLL
jgi:hypothetical protein